MATRRTSTGRRIAPPTIPSNPHEQARRASRPAPCAAPRRARVPQVAAFRAACVSAGRKPRPRVPASAPRTAGQGRRPGRSHRATHAGARPARGGRSRPSRYRHLRWRRHSHPALRHAGSRRHRDLRRFAPTGRGTPRPAVRQRRADTHHASRVFCWERSAWALLAAAGAGAAADRQAARILPGA